MLKCFKKKKLYVIDGFIQYPIDVSKCHCICSSPRKPFCPHLEFILDQNGINLKKVMPFLREPHIWQRVKSRILITTGTQLQKIIEDFKSSTECSICIAALNGRELWQCPNCKNFAHNDCMLRWKKNCPNCRQSL